MDAHSYGRDFTDGAAELLERLALADVDNVGRLLTVLSEAVPNVDVFLNHFIEGWGADWLLANGFTSQYEPCGKGVRGPDLLVSGAVYVEVTRIAENAQERAELRTGALVEKRNLVQLLIGKIEDKLGQMVSGKPNLLIIRSSRGFVDYEQAKMAFDGVVQKAEAVVLSGLVFDDGWTPVKGFRPNWTPIRGPRIRLDENPSSQMRLPSELVHRMRLAALPPSDPLVQKYCFQA